VRVPSNDSSPRWLSQAEQHAWRSWLSAHLLLTDALDKELKAEHGITLVDYEIFVRLSEAPDRALRMSELAQQTTASRSRLSHQIARMESKGWVQRRECVSDGRGTLATLTDAGWELLVRAAPSHVASVRHHLVDVLTAKEMASAGEIADKVVRHLQSGHEGANRAAAGAASTAG
jgi:DNA-binding MarR family transcriptional regulator